MTANIELTLMISTLVWPLVLAAALVLPKLRRGALALVPFAATPALFTALIPSPDFELSLPWMLLGTDLGLDGTSSLYLLFSAILWTVGGVSLPESRKAHFAGWFLVTMAGNFAVLLARDIPSFFLFYTVVGLSAFGLVLHELTASAQRAAKVYLVFAVLGEVVLLAALIMVAYNADTLEIEHVADRTPQHLLMALLLVGFGIKAGIPLLHLAMPPAYGAVPLAAAVPLAGALFHLGLYGWMRFLPLGQLAVPVWSAVYAGVGAAAVFYGIAIGLMQRQPRALLAYSSISQMGLMTIGVGIGIGSPDHWLVIQQVLLLFALHHALAKGALFYGLGIQGKTRICLWLPALALAGLPFTGGALAKGLLKAQVSLMPATWSAFFAWVVPLGSVGTALLMARFLYLTLKKDLPLVPTTPITWWLLLMGMLLLPWVWPLELERFSPIWDALWPVLLAAGPAWVVYRGGPGRFPSTMPSIPSGDILVLVENFLQRVPSYRSAHTSHNKEYDVVLQPRGVPELIRKPECLLRHWPVAVGLLLLLVLGLFTILAGRPQ